MCTGPGETRFDVRTWPRSTRTIWICVRTMRFCVVSKAFVMRILISSRHSFLMTEMKVCWETVTRRKVHEPRLNGDSSTCLRRRNTRRRSLPVVVWSHVCVLIFEGSFSVRSWWMYVVFEYHSHPSPYSPFKRRYVVSYSMLVVKILVYTRVDSVRIIFLCSPYLKFTPCWSAWRQDFTSWLKSTDVTGTFKTPASLVIWYIVRRVGCEYHYCAYVNYYTPPSFFTIMSTSSNKPKL